MRTIVVNCDPDWDDWPTQLRTRAMDLYPRHEAVQFWMLGPESSPAQRRIWGGWPRHLAVDRLSSELAEAIQSLREGSNDQLAIILVLAHPEVLGGAADPPMAMATTLQRLAEERSRNGAERASRIMRIVAFRRGAADRHPGALPAALELVGQPGLAEAALFLTPPEIDDERRLRTASDRVFDALRLLIDLTRDGEGNGRPGPGWELLRRQPGSEPMVLWLKPPSEGRVRADPSAELRARIIAFVWPRLVDQGTSVLGEAIQDDLKGLDEAISAVLQSDRTASGQNREREARNRLPEAPSAAGLTTIDAWLEAVQSALGGIRQTAQERVRRALESQDPELTKRSQAIEEKAAKISLVNVGMTTQAQRKLQALLGRVAQGRAAAAREAEAARHDLMAFTQAVGLGDAAAAAVRQQEVELRARHDAWRQEAVRQVPRRLILYVVLAAFLALYGLLVTHVIAALPAEVGWLRILALDFNTLRLALLAGFGAAGLAIGLLCQSQQQARWDAARATAMWAADQVADTVDQLTERSAEYARKAAIAGELEPLEQRLRRLSEELAPAEPGRKTEFREQVELLRSARPHLTVTETERSTFENRVQGQLADERLEDWLALLLMRAEAPPMEEVTLDFGDWRPPVTLRSRLRLEGEPVLHVFRLASRDLG